VKLHKVIPALAAPGREGLAFDVMPLEAAAGERMLLSIAGGEGAAILHLGKTEGVFVFAHGKATAQVESPAEGRAFVDAVAAWLGLALEPMDEGAPAAAPSGADAAPPEAEVSWVKLGDGESELGGSWEGFKLFLSLGERNAEVFFRRSSDGKRAELVEKWSAYRTHLVEILERLVTGSPPRRCVPRASPPPSGKAAAFGVHAAFDLEVPEGWILTERPEGHHRLADRDDEMMIEFSYLRLPPLPPDAPDVIARLRATFDPDDTEKAAGPITSFERGDTTYAWAEYRFDSNDTNRPEAPPRPARGRTLVAANPWIQVLVTSCWWDDDADVAERAWNGVIDSLALSGRVAPANPTRGDA
jgi:hypothetical protein